MMTMTRTGESTATMPSLLLAFELGERSWKLRFTIGLGQRPRIRSVPAGAMARVWAEIADAKARFQVSADAPVISCYEAGRDGFWIHRALALLCQVGRERTANSAVFCSVSGHPLTRRCASGLTG